MVENASTIGKMETVVELADRKRLRMHRKMLRIAKKVPSYAEDAGRFEQRMKNKNLFFDEKAMQLKSRLEMIFRDLLLRKNPLVTYPKKQRLFSEEELQRWTFDMSAVLQKVEPEASSPKEKIMNPERQNPFVHSDAVRSSSQTIQLKEQSYGPVGTAITPPLSTSEGHERFFPSYSGTWKDGEMCGHGTFIYADGSSYEGQWKFNRPHGLGCAKYVDGSRYEGEWVSGRYHGRGTLTGPHGIVFVGQFREGKRHGTGEIRFPSGQLFSGSFKNGKPHDQCVLRDSTGTFVFIGTLNSGLIDGRGVMEVKKSHFLFPTQTRVAKFWPRLRFKDTVDKFKHSEKARITQLRDERIRLRQGLYTLDLSLKVKGYYAKVVAAELQRRQEKGIMAAKRRQEARRKKLAKRKANAGSTKSIL